jgi:beta-1,4-mannooligosaccharide/beta-1,4-mannosyl-N-acetylglucosamine phosphorylase
MPDLTSARCITRYEGNPVLAAADVPYPTALVFNAGVTKWNGRYMMVFRNDHGDLAAQKLSGRSTLGLAFSDDGKHWAVEPEPCWEWETDEIRRVYDPRLTILEDRCYLCFAVDTRHGVCGGIAVTDDFKQFEVLSVSVPDNRNMVVFPEKISGKFARLERPFPVYSRRDPESFDIWFSDSPDARYWGNSRLVLGAEQVPWSNLKIGPGAPPVRTGRGWLAATHAVDREDGRVFSSWSGKWEKRYTVGLILLDLDEPWRVVGMSRNPLLVPEEPYDYELHGFRGSVIFPGGMILEDDGEVKIYYGAADTVECLATAQVDDLLAMCEPV